MTRYVCSSDFYGLCGVRHRTISGADAHCAAHQAAIKRASSNAYSDRHVEREGGSPLSEDELKKMYRERDKRQDKIQRRRWLR